MMKYFKQEEFYCPCGKCTKKAPTDEFLKQIDALRELLGKPIKITSGVRCAEHNKAVGGVPNSQHVEGIAADIDITKYSSEDKYNLVKHAISLGFGGIGIGQTFIHIDIRKVNKAIWMYGNKSE